MHGDCHRCRPCRCRSGFTLLELTVALAVSGMVLVLAHALLSGVTDAAARARDAITTSTTEANQRAWLTRTFGSAEVRSRPARGFSGLNRTRNGLEADEMVFAAVVRTGGGHQLRLVRLALDGDRRLTAQLRLPPGPRDARPDTLVLSDRLVGFGAEYLLDYGASSRWVAEWVSPVSAPVAARLRLLRMDGRADTLVLHLGVRG